MSPIYPEESMAEAEVLEFINGKGKLALLRITGYANK